MTPAGGRDDDVAREADRTDNSGAEEVHPELLLVPGIDARRVIRKRNSHPVILS